MVWQRSVLVAVWVKPLSLRNKMSQYSADIHKIATKTLMQFYLQQHKGRVFYYKTPLDFIDISLLSLIIEQPKTIKEVVDLTGYERKEVAKHVNKFIMANFAKKSDAPDDRRMTIISITSEGRAAFHKIIRNIDEVLHQSVQGLTLKEEKTVLKYLNQLYKALLTLEKPTKKE